jgi:hypothetical protein
MAFSKKNIPSEVRGNHFLLKILKNFILGSIDIDAKALGIMVSEKYNTNCAEGEKSLSVKTF